jgi:hypothetical protein
MPGILGTMRAIPQVRQRVHPAASPGLVPYLVSFWSIRRSWLTTGWSDGSLE